MNQDFNKVFKTPKYTGVTLALLSMFVLACMMAVWNKLSVKTSGEHNSTSLEIICEKGLEAFIRPATRSFFDETRFNSKVSFVSSDELHSLISENIKSKVFIISEKNKLNLDEISEVNFFEEITIGFQPIDSEIPISPNAKVEPIYCVIGKGVKKPFHAYALCRFIKSSDRGHSIMEENGFIPSEGDDWQITPSIIVYATPELREELRSPLEDFSEREGVKVELNIKSSSSIEKTVSLIAKSQARQYLPDVLFGYVPDANFKNLYSFFSKGKLTENIKIGCVSNSSKVWHTSQRMILGVGNYFGE